MSQRGSQAEDFTDSSNSFQCRNVSNIESATSCSLNSMSPDSLDETATKASQEPRGALHDNNHSIILAGSSIKNRHLPSLPNTSASLVALKESAPNSFQNELLQAQSQCIVNSTQCAMTDKQSRNEAYETIIKDLKSVLSKEEVMHSRNITSENSKKDVNYNICRKFDTASTSVENVPNKETQTDIQDDHESVSGHREKFESILCSLDNQYTGKKKVSEFQQIVRRLSDKYIDSPMNFTERLLTIIEESVINAEENSFGPSAINLRRLAAEFRQMCKFIEDLSTERSQLNSEHNKPCNTNICKNEESLPITPLSGVAVTKRFFQKSRKNNDYGSVENLISTNASLESFENLEAQCKRIFSEDQEYSHPLRKSISVPYLLSMNQIENICEKQMVSLNYSTADEDRTIVNSPKLSEKVYSKTKSIKLNKHSKFNKPNTKGTHDCMTYDPDELEKTFLQDISEKRKRCLDTARLSIEITGDPVTAELQKSLGMSFMSSTDSDSNSISHNEVQFFKTLTSCKNYQTYLENKKPFFNLLRKPNAFSRPNSAFKTNRNVDLKCKENSKEISNKKKTAGIRSNISTTKSYNRNELPLTGKKDRTNKGNANNAKPTFFCTPGRSPQKVNYKKNKLYFPSPEEKLRNILKSQHTKRLYKSKYNSAVSPVGMYIRGADMQVTKNIRAKTDMLFSSAKKNVKKSPNSNLQQPTTSGTSKTQRNVETNRPYEHEIKETEPTKPKTRAEKLLETAENRIINRHKELLPRRIRERREHQEVPEMIEINYDTDALTELLRTLFACYNAFIAD